MSVDERFWAKVDKNGPVPPTRPDLGPCWLWVAGVNAGGYGKVNFNGLTRRAHVVAYELSVGPVPGGLDTDHLCRGRSCVNPAHLEPVTRSQNIRRGIGPAKLALINGTKTHCPRGHPYSGGNLYARPDGGRDCRACLREAGHRYRQKRKMT